MRTALRNLKDLSCRDTGPLDILKEALPESVDLNRRGYAFRVIKIIRMMKIASEAPRREGPDWNYRFKSLDPACEKSVKKRMLQIYGEAQEAVINCVYNHTSCKQPQYGEDGKIRVPGYDSDAAFKAELEEKLRTAELYDELCLRKYNEAAAKIEDFHLNGSFHSITYFALILVAESKMWEEFQQTLKQQVEELLGKSSTLGSNLTFSLEMPLNETKLVDSSLRNFFKNISELRSLDDLLTRIKATESNLDALQGRKIRADGGIMIHGDNNVVLPLWVLAFCYHTGVIGDKESIRNSVTLFVVTLRKCGGKFDESFVECQ